MMHELRKGTQWVKKEGGEKCGDGLLGTRVIGWGKGGREERESNLSQ